MNRGVEIQHLKKNFVLTRWSGFRRKVSEISAVDDINLSIPRGESVALIGPNGANTDMIRDMAMKNGMLDLKHYAMFLMAQGLTSVEEVLTNLVVSN